MKVLSLVLLIIATIIFGSCVPNKGPSIINGSNTEITIRILFDDGYTALSVLPGRNVLGVSHSDRAISKLVIELRNGPTFTLSREEIKTLAVGLPEKPQVFLVTVDQVIMIHPQKVVQYSRDFYGK